MREVIDFIATVCGVAVLLNITVEIILTIFGKK